MRQRSGGSRFEASLGQQFTRPYFKKKTITKKYWWSGSRCRSEFKPQHDQKININKIKNKKSGRLTRIREK
jgi:hypothetical protein